LCGWYLRNLDIQITFYNEVLEGDVLMRQSVRDIFGIDILGSLGFVISH
jgi:hypothetical protein